MNLSQRLTKPLAVLIKIHVRIMKKKYDIQIVSYDV